MISENCVICAFRLNNKGGAQPIHEHDLKRELKSNQSLSWVHLDLNNNAVESWLHEHLNYLDEFAIRALLAEDTRPRVEEYGNGILLNLRGVNLNENSDPEDMVSIRLWVDEHRIISLRHRRLKAVEDIRHAFNANRGPSTSGNFISDLSSRLFNRMEPTLASLSNEADDLEETVLDQATQEKRKDIVELRRQSIIIRRYMMPQRDVIGRLKTLQSFWMSDLDRRHLQESHDRVIRYIEDLELIRERTQIIQDELTNALADKLNKNMYVLSIVAAIFLPLGFLTGLFGINVGGLPMAESPYGFLFFNLALFPIVGGMLFWFKKKHWLP